MYYNKGCGIYSHIRRHIIENLATIGTLYSIGEYIWAVIENDEKDKTTTIEIINCCPLQGKKVRIATSSIDRLEPKRQGGCRGWKAIYQNSQIKNQNTKLS